VFLSQVFNPVMVHLKKGAKGLDFGCNGFISFVEFVYFTEEKSMPKTMETTLAIMLNSPQKTMVMAT
jgi:hypothetical protein